MIFVTIHQYTDGKKAGVSRHWAWGAPKRAGSLLYWLFMFVETIRYSLYHFGKQENGLFSPKYYDIMIL